MKQKKKNAKKRKQLLLITLAILITLITILGIIFLINDSQDKNKTDVQGPTEEIIEQNYSFTKEDAINLIKPLFHSDNYSFSAELNKDSLYVVTIINTLTSTKYIYYVDPATKTYRIDESTK